jgi:hypothetical protein
MSNESSSEPKIIVDEDWKSRVEAERKAAEKAATPETASEPSATAAKEAPKPATSRPMQLPPATFSFLVTTLATQAMVSLGEAPNPFTDKVEVHLPEAKHFIDTLAMLEDKTRGNLTPEEHAMLDAYLHQLRLAYVESERAGRGAVV